MWLLVGLLFLSATGLTWSTYAGANFSSVLDAADGQRPSLDTTLPQASAGGDDGGSHAGHTAGGSGDSTDATSDAPDAGAVDTVLSTAREAGLHVPVEMSPPAEAGTAWSVAQTDTTWPVRLDQVAVDPNDGTIVNELHFSDWPLLVQFTKFGIDAHMGLLFGLANQILLASLAIGLICLII